MYWFSHILEIHLAAEAPKLMAFQEIFVADEIPSPMECLHSTGVPSISVRCDTRLGHSSNPRDERTYERRFLSHDMVNYVPPCECHGCERLFDGLEALSIERRHETIPCIRQGCSGSEDICPYHSYNFEDALSSRKITLEDRNEESVWKALDS